MATTTKITCDVHEGSELVDAIGTRTVVIDGKAREIDLCQEHDAEMAKTFDEWLQFGRPAANGHSSGRSRSNVARRSRNDLSAVRQWARDSGYDLADRGRIPVEIMEAYENRSRGADQTSTRGAKKK